MDVGKLVLSAPAVLRLQLIVAVASNFATPMKTLTEIFTKDTGQEIIVSYGASAKFYTQIKNGAPFEVFLSADQEYPRRLVAEKVAVGGSQFTYAVGKLVLWSAKAGKIEESTLLRGDFKHLALANPKLAPYGVAARETLTKLGMWEKMQSRLVMGENITQAFEFAATQNAELGFVALSQVRGAGGSYWLVPQEMYSPLRQDAVLLRRTATAEQFLQFLKSERARTVINESGYDLP